MTSIFDELEVATVDQIKGKRFDNFKKQTEYLVSWKEYPGMDTWESVDNLQTVRPLLDAYDEDLLARQRAQQEAFKERLELLRKREDEKKHRERERMVENMGSWDKGDRMHRVVGQKIDKSTGQLLCLCEWQRRSNGVWPIKTFQKVETVNEQDPLGLLAFYEFHYLIYGKQYPKMTYPKYYTIITKCEAIMSLSMTND